jgi:dTDP-4-dehydrorhamnose reductase
MKILVVGSGGQLARALREVADAHCAQVVTLGRPIVDLTEPATISACLARTRFDIVINTAAFTHVDRAEAESDAAFALNTEGAAAIASACEMQRLPLIHISTDYVFGGDKTTPFAEGDIPAPLNVYGRSKLAGERRVAELCPNHIIVRTSWLHSPFCTNFVKTILRLAELKDEVAVVDDQIGSPTSAFHLADALLRIAAQVLPETAHPFANTYHVAGDGTASRSALAKEVLRCSRLIGGPHARVRSISSADCRAAALRPHNSALDCSNLEQRFGIKLPRWEDGVRHSVSRLLAERHAAAGRLRAEGVS